MPKGKQSLTDVLIDSIYFSASEDRNILKDDPRLSDRALLTKIEETVREVESSLGRMKIKEGIERGAKIENILDRLKNIGVEQVNTVLHCINPDLDQQMVTQFYRKLNGSVTDSSLDEDSLYLNILENIDEIEEHLYNEEAVS